MRTDAQDDEAMLREGGDTPAAAAPPSPDQCLETITYLMQRMAGALGEKCEIVLHDFRQQEHSIVALAGRVTGRRKGGSVSQIGLSILREGDDAKPHYSYITTSPNGRILRSITVPLRDADNHVFGAFCVNFDVTEMWMMGQSIQALLGTDAEPPKPVSFVDDIHAVIADVIRDETSMLGRPLHELSRAERLQLLKALDFRGVFSLQKSIPQIADYLGLSRATLYSDLKRMRQTNSANADGPHDEPET
jgi:predicted transcriptional regulator YheO